MKHTVKPYHTSVWSRFKEVSEECLELVAISQGNKEFSYENLYQTAFQISHQLIGIGIKKGDVIGIFHDKSFEGFALMMACLRLGAPYVNFDPDSPQVRLNSMLETSEPKVVITCGPHYLNLSYSWEGQSRLIPISSLIGECSSNESSKSELSSISASDPAYLMFTSGSTGNPKAVVISNGSLLNFIDWARTRFQLNSDDRVTNLNPLFFDNSVFDFYSSLFSGACLCPVPAEITKNPSSLVSWITQLQCTIWFSVPSLLVYLLTMRSLCSSDFPNIRKIIFGGEGFPKKKLKELYDLFGNRIDLENVYGPTECTCICSAHTIQESDFEDMTALATLGYLTPNFDYTLLSQDEKEDEGELLLLGPQVGLGYYNSEAETGRSFIQNPAHGKYRDIGYRTGDMVVRDAQGKLHFKGRVDFQIKHMGYRIEIEEIECALVSLSGVHEAAANYQKLGEGMGRIIGYVRADMDIAPEQLKDALAKKLPAYMLPKIIVTLDSMPKNANGKIDRKSLPLPGAKNEM